MDLPTDFVLAVPKFQFDGTKQDRLRWLNLTSYSIRGFKATLYCPQGHVISLRLHTVEASGLVAPSVVCHEPGCKFSAHVRLLDWTYGHVTA